LGFVCVGLVLLLTPSGSLPSPAGAGGLALPALTALAGVGSALTGVAGRLLLQRSAPNQA
jgi:hypothetical protein